MPAIRQEAPVHVGKHVQITYGFIEAPHFGALPVTIPYISRSPQGVVTLRLNWQYALYQSAALLPSSAGV